MPFRLTIFTILFLVLIFTASVVFALEGEDVKYDQSKNNKGDKKASNKKKKDDRLDKFMAVQERRGLAIGPRLGVYMPFDDDMNEHLPFMFQSGVDLKLFPLELYIKTTYDKCMDKCEKKADARRDKCEDKCKTKRTEKKKWPSFGITFGLGIMGGGDVGEIDTADGEDEDGNYLPAHEVDAYWGTSMIPLTFGLTFEAVPWHVFDPYIGGGVGYYLVFNARPMEGLPPQYEQKWAPVKMDPGSTVGFYGVGGVDIKFHDYMGVRVEGSYHFVELSEDDDISGLMITVAPWVYF